MWTAAYDEPAPLGKEHDMNMTTVSTRTWTRLLTIGLAVFAAGPAIAQPRLDGYRQEAAGRVDEMAKLAQEMVDSVSFSELGSQEVETSRYLTAMLEKNGFSVRRGVAGVPTAWVATFGSGKPGIALGSDIDGIPQASQKPGVSGHSPIVDGAPGHGEGHNTGVPLNIVAALAVKRIMERDKLPGTLVLWPGVAEELPMMIPTSAFAIGDKSVGEKRRPRQMKRQAPGWHGSPDPCSPTGRETRATNLTAAPCPSAPSRWWCRRSCRASSAARRQRPPR
jgi:hypothetical protein